MFHILKNYKKCILIVLLLSLHFNSWLVAQPAIVSTSHIVKDLVGKSLDLSNLEPATVDKKKKLELQNNVPSYDQMYWMALHLNASYSNIPGEKLVPIDRTFLKKMEICCGDGDEQASLMSAIDKTVTVFGRAMLVNQLAQPSYNTQRLYELQAIVKELLTNQEDFLRIQKELENIKSSQADFFAYFEKSNVVNEELFKKLYWGDLLNFLNKSSLGLEAGTRLNNVVNFVMSNYLPLLGVHTMATIVQTKATFNSRNLSYPKACVSAVKGLIDPQVVVYKDNNWDLLKNEAKLSYQNFQEVNLQYQQALVQKNTALANQILQGEIPRAANKFGFSCFNATPQTLGDINYLGNMLPGKTKYIIMAVLGAMQGYTTYTAVQDTLFRKNLLNHLQQKLISVAAYVTSLKKLNEVMHNNPILNQMPELAVLAQLTDPYSTLSAQSRELLSLLDHRTFAGKASLFSLSGRVLRAHKLMQAVKEELAPACIAAGKIDMYMSIAKLYTQHQNTSARYSFAHYIDNAALPEIIADNFWNPFIDAQTVVANDIKIGHSVPHNIIVTGPNTGGKSTVIKALLINILLAQTIGIVPADSLSMTPFAYLNCYLNITDDLNAGTSLFKAEVLRAKTLIESIRNLKPQEFSFTIIDEIFSGTSPKEGEEAAVMFAQQIGTMAQSMCSIATHFPRLTDELNNAEFKNYQVSVYKDANQQWVRPFKLQEGKSSQNIAMDLLRDEGIF